MKKRRANSNLTKLQEDVEHVYKTVYQGNGKPSIINQLSNLDQRIKSLEENFDTRINNLEKEMELKFINIQLEEQELLLKVYPALILFLLMKLCT